MLPYHFVDSLTGLCVQTLRVLRDDMTHAEADKELAATAAAQGRTMMCLTCDPSHVCALTAQAGF